jgi:GNAT superfamily N-acetyltransferase
MEKITIHNYSPTFQQNIDRMMEGIGLEFDEPISSPQSTVISRVYDLPDQHYWVAMCGEEVAGTIGIARYSGNSGVLKRMMVDKKYRGPSYNTALLLLNASFDWARKNSITKIFLGTMTQFKAAQRFYEKNGFIEIEKDLLPGDYEPNPIDSIYYMFVLK